MQAQDNGLPPRRGYALVYVYVTRNFSPPVWDRSSYETRVDETQSLDSVFYTVTVSDGDNQVSVFFVLFLFLFVEMLESVATTPYS